MNSWLGEGELYLNCRFITSDKQRTLTVSFYGKFSQVVHKLLSFSTHHRIGEANV